MNEIQKTGYSSFKDDPISQLCLVNKYVKVELIKTCFFEGFVHSLDPNTNSIILSIPQDDTFKCAVIPGHAILNVSECTMPSDVVPPSRISPRSITKDLVPRKNKLVEWLKSNLLPVTEVDEAIVFGNVSILPPYSTMDICTDSPMVAMQIKKLIENMPVDNESYNVKKESD